MTTYNEEQMLDKVNTFSKPSELRITDVRFADIEGAPMHCMLMKICTNQGIEGYGEVRDNGSKLFAQMLKSRIIGENPCDVDRIFRRIKQFGGHSRQGGGVSGVEIALWDLAGKAYGVPIYQMLGGRFRDKVRMYCDTDIDGKHDGTAMGNALKERMAKGYTFLKMDLGIDLLYDIPGALCAPLGSIEEARKLGKKAAELMFPSTIDEHYTRNRGKDAFNVMHPFTGWQITPLGMDWLEQYVADVRAVIGYEIPLALDHFGHIGLNECIRLGQRLEKFNIAWLEDMIPWQLTEQYARLQRAVNIPIATGEDIYLKENFKPLLDAGGISVAHPDILTSGGILETKKIGDMAQEYGVAMGIHMAESPIACIAAAHVAAATENFLGLEYHSVDVPWWDDLVNGLSKPIVDNGFINVPEGPGLGIESLNDEVIAEHISSEVPGLWEPTEEWNHWLSHDRLWS